MLGESGRSVAQIYVGFTLRIKPFPLNQNKILHSDFTPKELRAINFTRNSQPIYTAVLEVRKKSEMDDAFRVLYVYVLFSAVHHSPWRLLIIVVFFFSFTKEMRTDGMCVLMPIGKEGIFLLECRSQSFTCSF